MAGVVPTKRSTSGRKQWTLHDGPRGSLKRLRSQLANDGCAESQVVLAKQLLEEECELDVEKRENDRLGVYWLIKSSEQGNVEATELLKKCFVKGKGITEHNYMDVKSCINMTQDEKLARKAAREMFASLSNGEEYITSQQLQKRMLEIDKDHKTPHVVHQEHVEIGRGEPANGELINKYDEQSESEEDVDWSCRSDDHNEKLTEEHVVAAAVDYSRGQLPLVNRIICTDPYLHALDHLPFVHRSILHPFLAFKILYHKLILFLGRQKNYFRVKSDVQVLLLMFLYSFVSSSNMLYFFPMVAYYLTFIIMVLATFQMLQMKRDYQDFRLWSGLFLTYSGGSLNATEAEYQFIRNNLKPYGHFFLALLVNLVIYPVISDQWIPQSELTIIAFLLTFMTLHSFLTRAGRNDLILLLSFAVNVLAKYPYETDPVVTQSWRFLDLNVPTFASYIIGNGIEFCINFRIIFYLFIPVLFVHIASRQNWRGTYKCLIPHCVTLSWLQIVIINSQGATVFGLLRGTLALVGIVVFLPLVGITSVLLPAVALTKWTAATVSLYSFCLFLLFASIGLGISWLFAKTRFSQQWAFLQVIIGICTFCFLINSVPLNTPANLYTRAPITLTWEQYQSVCHQPAWESKSIATTQIFCLKLADVPVEWQGYVNEIKITSITNDLKTIIDKFPKSVKKHLYCLYGESNENSLCSSTTIEDCPLAYNTNRCNLDQYNKYKFEIPVRMHSGLWGKSAEVVLVAEHAFANFSLNLKPNDKIQFRGSLLNYEGKGAEGILGGAKPHVRLEEIRCVACHNSNLSEQKLIEEKVINVNKIVLSLCLGLKFVLNFVLYPIVILK